MRNKQCRFAILIQTKKDLQVIRKLERITLQRRATHNDPASFLRYLDLFDMYIM